MAAASKKRQIGFVTGQDRKPGTGNRKLPDPLSEGPKLGLFKVRLTPYQFSAVQKSKFVKLRVVSKDGKFAIDMIIKDAGSFLVSIPRNTPALLINMEADAFQEKMESKTIVMLENGLGQNKGYKIAALSGVELMNDGKWAPAKKHFVN
jgi:hypothetical protein